MSPKALRKGVRNALRFAIRCKLEGNEKYYREWLELAAWHLSSLELRHDNVLRDLRQCRARVEKAASNQVALHKAQAA